MTPAEARADQLWELTNSLEGTQYRKAIARKLLVQAQKEKLRLETGAAIPTFSPEIKAWGKITLDFIGCAFCTAAVIALVFVLTV